MLWVLYLVFFNGHFLAVQNSSIGDLVPCSGTTNNQSLHNTKEWPKRLVTFETFDQSYEETWPDQKNTYLPTYLPTRVFLKNTFV